MKDNFSKQSKEYALFRPQYPGALFDYLISLAKDRKLAWDCGTGNGQVAVALANYFEKVMATDISENQIKNAFQKANITYSIQRAEHTSFHSDSFDLITVAQAIHWFDFSAFYKEVNRTLKSNGIIAVTGYHLARVSPEIDIIVDYFYSEILDGYWDKERNYIDEYYRTIPFPFPEIEAPEISMTSEWNFETLIGFLNTWSAVQHYIQKNHKNPVDIIYEGLKSNWGNDEKKTVSFPLFMRMGRKS
jgi:SAM-dependent methyltransferase